jgi:hypothetical protein
MCAVANIVIPKRSEESRKNTDIGQQKPGFLTSRTPFEMTTGRRNKNIFLLLLVGRFSQKCGEVVDLIG